MSGAAEDAPSRLHWPDDLDEATFLARHWQRAPLLMRRALPGFETPLPPDELAGLALEPDTTPRLIRKDARGRFTLEHGPFDERVFETLGARDWSLMVTDVEKHLPELVAWLEPFRIVPDWRFDDLMVSYAPDGASVGAHVDEYDVFLVQASGTRRWSIDARSGVEHASVADGDLRLVADFVPTDTWELVPGDILYLPPGVPHHGVAVGDGCTTWSIGFRAPSAADVVAQFAELLAERLAPLRLRDEGVGRGTPGEIAAATVDAVGRLWQDAVTLDRETLIELTGRLLTASGTAEPRTGDAPRHDPDTARRADALVASPFARLAWSSPADGSDGTARLFADGETLTCSRPLAERLCGGEPPARASDGPLDAADRSVLERLLERGVLVRREDVSG